MTETSSHNALQKAFLEYKEGVAQLGKNFQAKLAEIKTSSQERFTNAKGNVEYEQQALRWEQEQCEELKAQFNLDLNNLKLEFQKAQEQAQSEADDAALAALEQEISQIEDTVDTKAKKKPFHFPLPSKKAVAFLLLIAVVSSYFVSPTVRNFAERYQSQAVEFWARLNTPIEGSQGGEDREDEVTLPTAGSSGSEKTEETKDVPGISLPFRIDVPAPEVKTPEVETPERGETYQRTAPPPAGAAKKVPRVKKDSDPFGMGKLKR